MAHGFRLLDRYCFYHHCPHCTALRCVAATCTRAVSAAVLFSWCFSGKILFILLRLAAATRYSQAAIQRQITEVTTTQADAQNPSNPSEQFVSIRKYLYAYRFAKLLVRSV